MPIKFRWLAADNDDSPWTNVTTNGTATYTGSPLRKVFGGKTTEGFAQLGHYLNDAERLVTATGDRYIAFVSMDFINSGSPTDAMVFDFMTDVDTIMYQSGNANYYFIYLGGVMQCYSHSGGPALIIDPVIDNQLYKLEIEVNANGTVDWWVNDVEVVVNQSAGNQGVSRGMGCDINRVGEGNNGSVSWFEAYITDSGGFPPPTPSDLEGSALSDTSVTIFWTQSIVSSTQFNLYQDDVFVYSSNYSADFEPGGDGLLFDQGLSPGTEYKFEVRATVIVNGVEYESADSNAIMITTTGGGGGGDGDAESSFLLMLA